MRRLAVFVEGYTEVLFIERLIREIAGSHNVVIDKRKILGGRTRALQVVTLEAADPIIDQQFYILVFDCGGDHQVKPRIVEQHQSLTRAGYEKIIGLRDVRPGTLFSDIPLLEKNLRYGIKTSLSPVEIVLAIMEIEAWFLAECSHFEKIHPQITVAEIHATLGFNPLHEDMSHRATPAADLEQTYQIAGKVYKKPAEETVQCLDYSVLYLELAEKIPYLKRLVSGIDEFLTPVPHAVAQLSPN